MVDRTPLVLLHGITASGRVWQPVVPGLSEHHEVIVPTLAGHRGGAELGEPFDLHTLVDAAEHALDEAGLATAHLVGNSLGGWIAYELARRGRARSLVLLSPAGGWSRPRDLQRLVRMFGLSRLAMARWGSALAAGPLRRPGIRRLLLRGMVEHPERLTAAAARDVVDDFAGCVALEPFLTWVRTAAPVGADAGVAVPVRLAWAAHDRTIDFKRYGTPWVAAMPGAELVTLPGVGHVPMSDDPGLVVRTILEVTLATARWTGATTP